MPKSKLAASRSASAASRRERAPLPESLHQRQQPAGVATMAVAATDAARHVIRRSLVMIIIPTCSEPFISRLAEPLVRSSVTAPLTPPDYGLLQGHGYQDGKDFLRFGGFPQRYSTLIGRSPRKSPSLFPLKRMRPPNRKLRFPAESSLRMRRQVGDDLVDASAGRRPSNEVRDALAGRFGPVAPVLRECGPRRPLRVRSIASTDPLICRVPSGSRVAAPFAVAHHDQPVEVESGLDLQGRSFRSAILLPCAVVGPLHSRHWARASGTAVSIAAAVKTGHQERSARNHASDCYWGNLKTGLIRQ